MELKDLNPGDLVVEYGGGAMSTDSLHKIDRVTATQIIIEPGGARFNRSSGHRVGSCGYYRRYIKPATEKDIKAIRDYEERARLIVFIDDKISYLRKWPTKYLRELKDIVERMNKESEATNG